MPSTIADWSALASQNERIISAVEAATYVTDPHDTDALDPGFDVEAHEHLAARDHQPAAVAAGQPGAARQLASSAGS